MTKYLLAHDLGTSGNKATLVHPGRPARRQPAPAPMTPTIFNGNWAEQNPQDWWRAICDSTQELLPQGEGRCARRCRGRPERADDGLHAGRQGGQRAAPVHPLLRPAGDQGRPGRSSRQIDLKSFYEIVGTASAPPTRSRS